MVGGACYKTCTAHSVLRPSCFVNHLSKVLVMNLNFYSLIL